MIPSGAPDPNGLRGRRVLVMGLGTRRGGVGVTRYLVGAGAVVRVTDLRDARSLSGPLDDLAGLPVSFTLGRHDAADFEWAEVVVRNPAVPRESPWLTLARERGARIEMEMTLFLRACPSPIAGVTGTKGKTTTTTLLHSMLREHWPAATLAGNMGVSALEQLPSLDPLVPAALELSSFQLEGLAEHQLAPHVAVITNIAEDHLDRYASFDDYAGVKTSIAAHQGPDDWLVIPGDDVHVDALISGARGRRITFGAGPPVGLHALGLADGRLTALWDGQLLDLGPTSALRLPGEHSRLNALAAAGAALALGVSPGQIRKALAAFDGVPNRLEHVATVNGVDFVNDTAATAPTAAVAALRAYDGREIVAIAGGSDKRLALEPLADALAGMAAHVVLLDGAATARLAELLRERGLRSVSGPCSSMDAAVRRAAVVARRGGIVLLSPGCASFGMFRDEFHRGDEFRAAVSALVDESECST